METAESSLEHSLTVTTLAQDTLLFQKTERNNLLVSVKESLILSWNK